MNVTSSVMENATAIPTPYFPELPESWEELMKLDRPIDFDAFLQSNLLASHRNFSKIIAIINSVSGSISFLSSCAIVYHILHSHNGLSTTYHRLVFGLCVADIMSSLGNVLSSTMTPTEMNYLTPFAQGNATTCTVQGSFLYFGHTCVALYNCSICLYYLAIVKYNKNDNCIQKKLEPWFHGVSIIVPLMFGMLGVTTQGVYHNHRGGGGCFIDPFAAPPPHCIGYEKGTIPEGFVTPCGEGDSSDSIFANIMMWAGYGIIWVITPIVIVGSMNLTYLSVRNMEKNMQKYGVGSLRLGDNNNASRTNVSSIPKCIADINDDTSKKCPMQIFTNTKNALRCVVLRCGGRGDGYVVSTRSNTATSQKKAILYMALGYVSAWFITWGAPFFIFGVFLRGTGTNIADIVLHAIVPLQGFFNMIVYFAPKVRNAKNARRAKNLTWCQAISKVWKSKGEERRRGSITRRGSAMKQQWMKKNASAKSQMIPHSTTKGSDEKSASAARRVGCGLASKKLSTDLDFTSRVVVASSDSHGIQSMKKEEEDEEKYEEFLGGPNPAGDGLDETLPESLP